MKEFYLNKYLQQFSTNTALIHDQHKISYRTFNELINRTSQVLNKHSILPGEKIALYGDASFSTPVVLLAILYLGAVAVPVSNRFPVNTIKEMLSSINCKKIILNGKSDTFDSNFFDLILPENKIINFESTDETSFQDQMISFKQDATIIFTSGSTAKPKAVLHSFTNHYYSALGSNENIKFEIGDRWLLSLPLYHIGGLSIIFRAFLSGGTVILQNKNKELAEDIKQNEISHISLVATQLFRLLQKKESIKILKNLKAILVGGSFIPSGLVELCIKNNLSIFTTYGLTEMASQITTTKPNDEHQNLFTSGRLLKYRQLKIDDNNEILVKGKTLFKGYVEKENTINPVDINGWYHTGDLGKIDQNGYLKVIGRKDNMFISGGENIHPEEIERALLSIPGLSRTIVIDIEDSEFGSRPVAFIDFNKNKSISIEMINKYLSGILPRFKIPIGYYSWPYKYDTMKPDRVEFKNLLINDLVSKL